MVRQSFEGNHMKILPAILVLASVGFAVTSTATNSPVQLNKTSGAPSLSSQATQNLAESEKFLMIELADETLRSVTSKLARPLVEQLMSQLNLQAVVGERLLKRFWVVQFPGARNRTELNDIVQRLRSNPAVLSVSENPVMRTNQFNDPAYPNQFSLYNGTNQGVPNTYNSEFVKLIERSTPMGERAVRIGVLDTGYANTPDLMGRFDAQANFVEGVFFNETTDRFEFNEQLFANATEPANSGPSGAEPFYHGTKVQSLLNAVSNNNSGVVGLRQNIEVSQLRVLGDSGGDGFDLLFAIAWAVGLYDDLIENDAGDPDYTFFARLPDNPKPVDIINMSLGALASCSEFQQSVIDFVLNNSDVLLVASAGNDALFSPTRVPGSPANCNGVISVGASNTLFGSAGYSNVSPELVTSTLGGEGQRGDFLPVTEPSTARSNNAVGFAQGTSFSAPLVSGVLANALQLGLKPEVTRASLIDFLRTTGVDYTDTTEFCGRNTDPATGMRPCGTILDTSAFLLAVTGKNIDELQPPSSAPPPVDSNPPAPPPEDVGGTEQPGTGEVEDQPNMPDNPNPPESKSVQFMGTVQNIDPLTVAMTANDTAVDPSSYSVAYSSNDQTFLITLSIPGDYMLKFEADRASQSQSVQPQAAGQTQFTSAVNLNATTREITAADPVAANSGAESPPVQENETPPAASAASGGGGGSLGLFGLLAMATLLLAFRKMVGMQIGGRRRVLS